MAPTTARRCSSSPMAEIITVALRRSEVTRTRDTDASRIRGSFISVSISEEISWRSCSATRSGRGTREAGPTTGAKRPLG